LQILKKNECTLLCISVQGSILEVRVPRATNRNFMYDFGGALEGKWYNPKDYSVEKGVDFLGLCRLRRTTY
jgi:hypothetical protein